MLSALSSTEAPIQYPLLRLTFSGLKTPEHETDRSHLVMMLTTSGPSLPAQYVPSRVSAQAPRQDVCIAHLQLKRYLVLKRNKGNYDRAA
jgi:hypothetical protein